MFRKWKVSKWIDGWSHLDDDIVWIKSYPIQHVSESKVDDKKN